MATASPGRYTDTRHMAEPRALEVHFVYRCNVAEIPVLLATADSCLMRDGRHAVNSAVGIETLQVCTSSKC